MPRRKEREQPKVGTIYTRRYKGVAYQLEVIQYDSEIVYLLNGTAYKTPTAAAKSLVKYEVNGPVFWKMLSNINGE